MRTGPVATTVWLAGGVGFALVVSLTVLVGASAGVEPTREGCRSPVQVGVCTDQGRLEETGPEPTRRAAARGAGQRVRHVRLDWRGRHARRREVATTRVPGVGDVDLICRSDAAMVRIRPDDPERETQLWMAKYEDKRGRRVVAVKTVRVYRHSHALDDGTGGTGPRAHEGLNRRGRLENYAKGYLHGVISGRPGRHLPTAGVATAPVTTLDLNWYWNGMRHPPRFRSCTIDAVLLTRDRPRLALSWHGEVDAVGHTVRAARVRGLGTVRISCPSGRRTRPRVSLLPDDRRTRVYVERVSGEGRVEDHVRTRNLRVNRSTGAIGPVRLPANGMLRLFVDDDGRTRPFALSSYFVRNDPDPRRNLCEVAMGAFPR